MGIYRLKLPDLGEGVVESEIITWRVNVGDQVVEDQPIADVMTDKATVEIGSPVDGVVLALACAAGEVLGVDQELIRFEVKGEGNTTAELEPATQSASPGDAIPTLETPVELPNASKTSPKELAAPAAETTPTTGNLPTEDRHHDENAFADLAMEAQTASAGDHAPVTMAPLYPNRLILTSPSVRRRAREAAIDLSMVPGSGPDGRIESEDLEIFIRHSNQTGTGSVGGTVGRRRVGLHSEKISGLRRVIAGKISAAKRNIPHYSYIEEVDCTELERLRARLNDQRAPHQSKLTVLPFIMRALINALPQHAHCNAHYDTETEHLTLYEPVHIGIATMTEQGLTVPVVRHAEAMDLYQNAAEISRLSQAVRSHKASRDELSGSTITITSLGALGGIATTPVINAPETAIIGINKLQERAMVIDGQIAIRKMMNISASFDHRIVDGYDGARLVQDIKAQLELPATLFT
ncbi:dihydrolipoamide acetyltransferase family protein [Halioxenophilus aromaticivorans]|uniref:Dihydrolipoamide acetyltransferase component of pyruvate dehydrogenase complex n=1 Tax=Halioxenophilus aromaticivorans TaxID=1306992 RepID=A0AAV3TYL8_9ALTE